MRHDATRRLFPNRLLNLVDQTRPENLFKTEDVAKEKNRRADTHFNSEGEEGEGKTGREVAGHTAVVFKSIVRAGYFETGSCLNQKKQKTRVWAAQILPLVTCKKITFSQKNFQNNNQNGVNG